jgi:predicted RNase H-like HicB family nuclease
MDTLRYSMLIQWSDEDEAYIVTVPELPGCKTHGSTYEEAVQQGKDAIETWILFLNDIGEVIPEPEKYAA